MNHSHAELLCILTSFHDLFSLTKRSRPQFQPLYLALSDKGVCTSFPGCNNISQNFHLFIHHKQKKSAWNVWKIHEKGVNQCLGNTLKRWQTPKRWSTHGENMNLIQLLGVATWLVIWICQLKNQFSSSYDLTKCTVTSPNEIMVTQSDKKKHFCKIFIFCNSWTAQSSPLN